MLSLYIHVLYICVYTMSSMKGGKMPEETLNQTLIIRVSESMKRSLDERVKKTGVPTAEFIRRAVQEQLDKERKEAKDKGK